MQVLSTNGEHKLVLASDNEPLSPLHDKVEGFTSLGVLSTSMREDYWANCCYLSLCSFDVSSIHSFTQKISSSVCDMSATPGRTLDQCAKRD